MSKALVNGAMLVFHLLVFHISLFFYTLKFNELWAFFFLIYLFLFIIIFFFIIIIFLQHDTYIKYIKVPFTRLSTYIALHYLQYS